MAGSGLAPLSSGTAKDFWHQPPPRHPTLALPTIIGARRRRKPRAPKRTAPHAGEEHAGLKERDSGVTKLGEALCQVGFGGRGRGDCVVLDQDVQDVGADECRQRRAKLDVLDAEVQQRKQDVNTSVLMQAGMQMVSGGMKSGNGFRLTNVSRAGSKK